MIVQIKPFKAKFTDKELASQLSCRITGDNLINSCTVMWEIQNNKGEMLAEGIHRIEGKDYKDWDGGNDFLINSVAAALPVELA